MRFEIWQGLKPGFCLGTICGTTEVMPCYKACFDIVIAAAEDVRLRWKFKSDCPALALPTHFISLIFPLT